jgi:YfiH family protein
VSGTRLPEDPQPVVVPAFSAQEALAHGFSTRVGGVSQCYRPGDLNLGFTKDDEPARVAENRRRFLQSIGADRFERFGLLRQIHSPNLLVIASEDEGVRDFTLPATGSGDALMTNVPGMLLTVQVADCIPVLLFDPKKRAVAAIHAGWRGTVARIAQLTAAAMCSRYGSDPGDILAAIGPGIGPHSYAVSEDLRSEFASAFAYADDLFQQRGSQLYLDLWRCNQLQLLDAGLQAGNVHLLGLDTATNTDRFFSHRAEKGFTGRMMAAIGLRP